MSADPRRVKDLFGAALELDPAARAEFLVRECADDADLRRRLEALLAAHDRPEAALDQPFVAPAGSTVDEADRAAAGAVVGGRYKLLEDIGCGGMGSVWMAEQRDPVKRLVAVKLIKPGMDSKAVLARFEAERQALALMDHPNIAKILDGGTTEAGRPYFVMELVKGLPLTEYCDARRLNVAERLELFAQVCGAVQHAHQKGVLHRDLKPSNILVTEHDGKPVPKVIDFGLAKALGPAGTLTERTLHTAYGAVVGTPLYMAPEQVGINALDVDTRTDVYALGVLLYELLTGTTPLEKQRFKQAAWDEIRRLIREEEPPRPSLRLSSSDALPSVAASRQTEPTRLTRLVQGELDWIVMKALEKDRNRRYDSASALALDVRRHLADEPVQACPPSASYRLRKVLRRQRTPLLVTAALLLVWTAGVVGTTWGYVRARGQQRRAEAAEAEATERARQATEERDRAERAAKAERQAREDEAAARRRAMDALRAMTDDVTGHLIGERQVLGETERSFLEAALSRWQAFAAETGNAEQARAIRAEGTQRVANLRARLGQNEAALAGYREAVELWGRLAADFPRRPEFPYRPDYRYEVARGQNNIGVLCRNLGRPRDAEAAYATAQALRQKLAQDFPAAAGFRRDLAETIMNRAILSKDQGRPAEAEPLYRQALSLLRQLVAELPDVASHRQALATCLSNYGSQLRQLRKSKEAEAAYREALDLCEALVRAHPNDPRYRSDLAYVQHNQATLLDETGRAEAAEALYRRALAVRRQLAAEFPAFADYRRELADTLNNLGMLLRRRQRPVDAEAATSQACAIYEKLVAEFPSLKHYAVGLGGAQCNLGNQLRQAGKLAEALAWYDKAVATLSGVVREAGARDDARRFLRNTYWNRAEVLDQLGRHAEAGTSWDRAIELTPASERARLEARRTQSQGRPGPAAEAPRNPSPPAVPK